jgi:hypothetical protein
MTNEIIPLTLPGEGYFIPKSTDHGIRLIDALFSTNGNRTTGTIPIGTFLVQVSDIKRIGRLEVELGFTQEDVSVVHPDESSRHYIANGEVVYNGKDPARIVYKVARDAKGDYQVTRLE